MAEIRDSLQVPPYKNQFDPQQIEMEQYLTKYLHRNTNVDEATAQIVAGALLQTVLFDYRPDLFEPRK